MFNYIGIPSVGTSLCSLNTHIADAVKKLLQNETSKILYKTAGYNDFLVVRFISFTTDSSHNASIRMFEGGKFKYGSRKWYN